MIHSKTKIICDDWVIDASNFKEVINSSPKNQFSDQFFSFLREFYSSSPYIKLHTSGTTGEPKTIQVLKSRMIASATMTGEYFSLTEADTALLSLPLTYIAGKMMVVRALVLGLTLYVKEPSSNPLINSKLPENIDFAPFVPLQMETMLNEPVSAVKLANIKQIIVGGAPISHQLLNQIKTLQNNVYETFGMTETVSHIAVRKISNTTLLDMPFEALAGVSFEVDNRSCLIVHAPQLLDKKIITNDVVDLHHNKSFTWKGRTDNVINSGGVKIFPEVLELAIKKLVTGNFFVGSLPHNTLGEMVILVIEKSSNNLNADWLKEEMKQVLPPHHLPKEIIVLPQFKRNPNGKLLRGEMLKEINDTMGRLLTFK